jgi:hypothetical protein
MRRLITALLFSFSAFALEEQPWFGDCLEFHYLGSYAYSFFDKVQNGIPQLTSTFESNVITMGLDFSPTPDWSIDWDIQAAATTQEEFNFRSAAMQARYLWLDDIIGDPISLATGANVRFTNTASLHDVSCPSRSHCDFEINLSLGKEFDVSDSFAWRTWGFAAVGHGIVGSPWVRAILAFETNYNDKHKLGFFAEGCNGYGAHRRVFIDDFDGYARIRQKNIDLSARYGYRLGVWGTLRFEYVRRVLAKSCPQDVNTFIFSYMLPFSL